MTKSRNILTPRRYWTDEELDQSRAFFPHFKTEDVATMIGRTPAQTHQKANGIGLRKTSEYLASPAACRLRRGSRPGIEHQFHSGQTPWNKGMKGLQIGGKESRFKSGQQPHNSMPIGSYRITKDGTLVRKVCEAKGSNSKRWRGVHELVWTVANGPLPRGHIVVFKPGMRTATLAEITLDRVECITLAENMRRNTRHNLPKEINDLIALSAALTRQINKRTQA